MILPKPQRKRSVKAKNKTVKKHRSFVVPDAETTFAPKHTQKQLKQEKRRAKPHDNCKRNFTDNVNGMRMK